MTNEAPHNSPAAGGADSEKSVIGALINAPTALGDVAAI